jgi:hypothetical protein
VGGSTEDNSGNSTTSSTIVVTNDDVFPWSKDTITYGGVDKDCYVSNTQGFDNTDTTLTVTVTGTGTFSFIAYVSSQEDSDGNLCDYLEIKANGQDIGTGVKVGGKNMKVTKYTISDLDGKYVFTFTYHKDGDDSRPNDDIAKVGGFTFTES